MRYIVAILIAIVAIAALSLQAKADIDLGTAGNFAVLAGTAVTNTGLTVINGGDVGVSSGSTITGFAIVDGGTGIITPPYTTHSDDAVASQAQNDLTTAYNAAAGLTPTVNLPEANGELAGLTLTPGVYSFSSASAQLMGTLTLDDEGDPNAQFVFQISSTLITGTDSKVQTIDEGGGTMPGSTVFWQVGSSATLGTDSAFEGHILALTSITMNTDATILDGSALARNGAVTLQSNAITNSTEDTSVGSAVPLPPPLFAGLFLMGMLAVGSALKRVKSNRVSGSRGR